MLIIPSSLHLNSSFHLPIKINHPFVPSLMPNHSPSLTLSSTNSQFPSFTHSFPSSLTHPFSPTLHCHPLSPSLTPSLPLTPSHPLPPSPQGRHTTRLVKHLQPLETLLQLLPPVDLLGQSHAVGDVNRNGASGRRRTIER